MYAVSSCGVVSRVTNSTIRRSIYDIADRVRVLVTIDAAFFDGHPILFVVEPVSLSICDLGMIIVSTTSSAWIAKSKP
ncbi:MAG: hypothetical protein MAG451_01406 [Anaerolineales bacterium]|nr:hypothetical protein [Anaerolineales bacterium]